MTTSRTDTTTGEAETATATTTSEAEADTTTGEADTKYTTTDAKTPGRWTGRRRGARRIHTHTHDTHSTCIHNT